MGPRIGLKCMVSSPKFCRDSGAESAARQISGLFVAWGAPRLTFSKTHRPNLSRLKGLEAGDGRARFRHENWRTADRGDAVERVQDDRRIRAAQACNGAQLLAVDSRRTRIAAAA